MTEVEQLAHFVAGTTFDQLSANAREQLKTHILDSLGCAIGALDGKPIMAVRSNMQEMGGSPLCTAVAAGLTAPDRAAFYNSALVRYLDFNDGYLAPHETCHPSDNLGAVLAAAEYNHDSGEDLLVALAVAYQVQCRLSDVAPVRSKGFDHTVQLAYGCAAGVARALELDAKRTAHAIAISGTANQGLRVTRTGKLSNWKGLAAPNTCGDATRAAFLALHGVTGPLEVFEGKKGLRDTIAGPFEIDWAKENLEAVTRTFLKRYNAELHSQATLETALALKAQYGFKPEEIETIVVDTFQVAYDIIGGGEEGGKKEAASKEEADHSLPYMVAVALLDGAVMPPQYYPARIVQPDVQELLRRIVVRPDSTFTARFPEEMATRVTIRLRDGRVFTREQADYEGFVTRPMTWSHVMEKFDLLGAAYVEAPLRQQIADAVGSLEKLQVADLTALLQQIPDPTKRRQA